MKNKILRKLITGILTIGLGASILTGCTKAQAEANPDAANANKVHGYHANRSVDGL